LGRFALPASILAVVLLLAVEQRDRFGYVVYSTNDRGRDLHAALMVSEGKLAFRDFDWPYGPLMPAYYALWFKAIGPSIRTFEAAELAMRFLTLAAVVRLGFCAAGGFAGLFAGLVWLLLGPIHGYYHTGNHIGGAFFVALMLTATIRLILRKGDPLREYAWLGASFLMLGLVKLNMAAAFGLVCFGTLRILSRRRVADSEYALPANRTLVVSCAAPITAVILVYGALLASAPRNAVPRCLPWLSFYRQDYGSLVSRALRELNPGGAGWGATGAWTGLAVTLMTAGTTIFFIGLIVAAFAALSLRAKGGLDSADASLAVFLCFAVLVGGHELLMAGAYYSVTFWAAPPIAVACVFAVSRLAGPFLRMRLGSAGTRIALALLAVTMAALNIAQADIYKSQGAWEWMQHPRARVMALRSWRDRGSWARAVEDATHFIADNSAPGEPILVVPMDAIYMFLADRPHACRTTDFSAIQNIAEDEQKRIIADMERLNVRMVVWTNTVISTPTSREVFGETHCRILADYIRSRYSPAATFGCEGPGDGFRNHGAVVWMRSSANALPP